VLKKDILGTDNSLLLEEKYELYKNIEVRFLMEYYFRIAYSYLREQGIINYSDEKKYCFLNGYENDFSLYYGICSRVNLIGYERLEGYNIIGLSLNPSRCNWKDYITVYKYFYVIEFCVDIFCNKFQSKYFNIYKDNGFDIISNNYHVDVLFKALDIDTKPSKMKEWIKNFNHKEWKHFLIYENETRYPNTFLQQIRKWYAPQLFYHEQKNKNIIYEKVICYQIFTPYKDTFCLEKEKKLTNFYESQTLEDKKKFLRKDYKKIIDLEDSMLTSTEIKKMKNFIPIFRLENDTNYIHMNDTLSPTFSHWFSYNDKKFETICDFVHYKLSCHFLSPREVSSLQISKNYFEKLKKIQDLVYNKKKFEFLNESMNNFDFKLSLITNDFSKDLILKEQQNDLNCIFVNDEFKNEKLRFLHQFELFQSWFLQTKNNNTKLCLQYFLKIFYPNFTYLEDLSIDEDYITCFHFELDDNSYMNFKEIFKNFSYQEFNFCNNFISSIQNLEYKNDFIKYNFQLCLVDIVSFYPTQFIIYDFEKIQTKKNAYCNTIWIENSLLFLKNNT
jgi:hypothetical protein